MKKCRTCNQKECECGLIAKLDKFREELNSYDSDDTCSDVDEYFRC